MTKHIVTAFKRHSTSYSTTSENHSASDPESRRSSEHLPGSEVRRPSVDLDGGSGDKFHRSLQEFYQRGRRLSLESGKSIRLHLELDEGLYPLEETNDEIGEEETWPSKTTSHASWGQKRRSSVGVPMMSSVSSKHSRSHVYATRGAIPDDLDEVCIIAPGMHISDAVVPDSVNDVVVARLDRMSPNEQLILKCASVLGMSFTREVLNAIVPRKIAPVLDTTLYKLSKERLLECGSLAISQSQQHSRKESRLSRTSSYHHHKHDVKPKSQVLCGCYAADGYPTINLSQTVRKATGKKRLCLFFHFCNTFEREAAYDLWLEDQRKALHERAAMYLETQGHLCKPCGGTSFVPGMKTKSVQRSSIAVRNSGKSFHF